MALEVGTIKHIRAWLRVIICTLPLAGILMLPYSGIDGVEHTLVRLQLWCFYFADTALMLLQWEFSYLAHHMFGSLLLIPCFMQYPRPYEILWILCVFQAKGLLNNVTKLLRFYMEKSSRAVYCTMTANMYFFKVCGPVLNGSAFVYLTYRAVLALSSNPFVMLTFLCALVWQAHFEIKMREQILRSYTTYITKLHGGALSESAKIQ